MKFALILENILNEEDKEAIIAYLERNKAYPGMKNSIKNMHFAIRRSNGLTFDRIDVFVNDNELIMPTSIEKDFTFKSN